jgi:hypothetical protein
MLGAVLPGTLARGPVYVKVIRPAVRLGFGEFQRASVVLSSGSTSYFAASR